MTANIDHWLKGEPVQNFGDFLSQFLVEELFYPVGMPARSIHIIGSVISDLFVPYRSEGQAPDKPIAFWGCGLRDPDSLAEERRLDTAIFSVRGPLSASELRLGATVPIGDPALVLPALHRLRPVPSFGGQTICVPHFHDKRSDDQLKEISGCDLVLRPDIGNTTTEILRFVDAIGAADFTLSASLHGALVAAAYGRPFAFWDNGDIDLPFKWRDTAALLQIPAVFCREIDSARAHYEVEIKPTIRLPSMWSSLAVAPLLLRPTGLLKVLRHELVRVTADVSSELDSFIATFEARSGHSEQLVAAIESETRELQTAAAQHTEAAAATAKASQAASQDRDAARQELDAARQELDAGRQELDAARKGLEAGRLELEVLRREKEAARRENEVTSRQLRDLGRQQKLLRFRLQRAAERIAADQRLIADADITARVAAQARQRAAQARQKAAQARQKAAQTHKKARVIAKARQKAEAQLVALHSESKALRKRVKDADAVISAMRNSTSWKITWPMRWVASAMPGTRTALRPTPTRSEPVLKSPAGRSQAVANLPVEPAPTSPQAEPPAEKAAMRPAETPVPGALKKDLDWLAPVVLMIDSVYPRPDQDSGSLDAVNFIEIFQTLGYQVAFIADAEFSVSSPARDALTARGVYCISDSDYRSVEAFLAAASAALDVCFLSRVDSGGRWVEAVRRLCSDAKIIFNTVDLHHVREMRQALLWKDQRAVNLASRTRERELAIARLADATIVVSEQEALLLSETIPGTPVFTIPLIRQSPGRTNGFAPRHGVGFVGGFNHPPNVDAVHHFLDTIWPNVRRQLPDVPFYIMGANMPDEIRDRTEAGVIPIGYVPNLATRLEELRVTVAPLRYGAGLKGKIASSLGHGVPCVATSIAAEGFARIAEEAIAVADTPEAFSQQVVALHTDEDRWTKMSDAGLALMASRHSFANGRQTLAQLLCAINAPVSQSRSSHVGPAEQPNAGTLRHDAQ